MPEQLPLFPLQLVLFPGERLKLHIFENRYKQLISECIDAGSEFGIATYFDGRVTEYGTAARVTECDRTYDTGEMDIATEGTRVFRLSTFEKIADGKLYAAGEAEWLDNVPAQDTGHEEEIWTLHARLHALLATGHDTVPGAGPNLSFSLGHEVGLTTAEQVELLAIPEEERRQRFLLDHLRKAVSALEGFADTRLRVQGNGQFHKFPQIDL